MKKYSRWFLCAIIIIGFLLTLYWVGFSNWSSQAVARHNGGYGTFDMKKYDVQTVENVLASMDSDGYKASYRYYVGDYLFIGFFGLIQCMISRMIYDPLKSKVRMARMILMLSILIPILRGVADLIENTILVTALLHYPNINANMIHVAIVATIIKLSCIKVWGFLIIIGLIIRMIWKCNRVLGKKE